MPQNETIEATRHMLFFVETDLRSAVLSGEVKDCTGALWNYAVNSLQSTNLKHIVFIGAMAASWSAYQIFVCEKSHKSAGSHE
jgi:hypothetical protein